MTAIGPANWEEYEPLKRRFRELLRQTVIRVLKTSMDPIDKYWSSLSDSSPGEQLLALHDDPLDLAAVLTGVTLTPEMTERYDRMLSETFSDLVLGNPPYSVGVVVDAVRSPGEDVVDEVPPDLYRDARPVRPEISGFVPRRAVTLLLERLGYSRLGREGQLAVWQLSDDGFQELPEVVLVPRPTISATGERGYDKRSVLNLYDWIIWLAQRRGASSETLRMLQDQRDQFAGGGRSSAGKVVQRTAAFDLNEGCYDPNSGACNDPLFGPHGGGQHGASGAQRVVRDLTSAQARRNTTRPTHLM